MDLGYPQPSRGDPDIKRLTAAWALSYGYSRWGPSAPTEALDEAERWLEVRFPRAFRTLYRMCDGLLLYGGRLRIDPLDEVKNQTAELRDANWPIPDELVIFGSNALGTLYGLWLPVGRRALTAPVLAVAELFEPACLAVVASSFSRFLLTQTAAHLLALGLQPGPAFSALALSGLPGDRAQVQDWLESLDPDLPFSKPDPYERPLDADQVQTLYGTARRRRASDPLTVDDL